MRKTKTYRTIINALKLIVFSVILFFVLDTGSKFFPSIRAIYYPMHTAIENDWVPVVKILSKTPLKNRELWNKGLCETPILKAIKRKKYEILDILIDNGASLERQCIIGNVLSASVGDPELLRHLIVDKKISAQTTKDGYGGPAALYATGCTKDKHKEASLRILLENGLDPNYASNTKEQFIITTSLLYRAAVKFPCPDSVKTLLEFGADPIPVYAEIQKNPPEFPKYWTENTIEKAHESISIIRDAAEKADRPND